MNKNILGIAFCVAACVTLQAANEKNTLSVGSAAAVSTALSRADVALARSIISSTAFRGSLGENLAGQHFLKDTLSKTGNWQMITPRSGPQGLDHLYIKTNSRGIPTDLLVGESKFNSSQLKMTRDGMQMGRRWTDQRLAALGGRYFSVARDSNIAIAPMPLNPNRSIEVTLKNGVRRHFWKNSSTDTWKFSGPQSELAQAKSMASHYGNFLQKAGNNTISYRSRIFNIVPKGNDIEIAVYEGRGINKTSSFHQLKKLSSIRLENVLSKNGKLPAGTREDMAKVFQSKLGMSDADARAMARNVQNGYSAKELLKPTSIHREIFLSSPLWIATGSAMVLDVLFQAAGTGSFKEIDYKRPLLAGVSTATGIVAGQYIKVALTTSAAQNAIRTLAGPLRCSTGFLTTAASSNVAALLAMALYNYGLFFWGGQDLAMANRQMLIGSVATGAGMLFAAGTMAALATWGTASTGTAIAALSGAAATNASLAILGGGTVAAGGLGVAGGALVLSGGTAIVVIGVTYIGYKLFELKEASDETKRISAMINFLSQEENLCSAILQTPYGRTLK